MIGEGTKQPSGEINKKERKKRERKKKGKLATINVAWALVVEY